MDKQQRIYQKSLFVAGSLPAVRQGFGGFSYSKSHVNQVIEYIKDQKAHHRKKTFLEEYHEFLEKFEVPYDERYIFKPVEYSFED